MVANLLLSTVACRLLNNPFRIMIQMRYSRVSRRRRPCSGFSRGGLSALSRFDLFVVDSPLSRLQNVCFRISKRCSFFRLVFESSRHWLSDSRTTAPASSFGVETKSYVTSKEVFFSRWTSSRYYTKWFLLIFWL